MTDDVHALAAAYALDALDPEERRRFESHYPDCETCAAEVREFRATASHLGATVPAPLPGDLKARVMADVGRTRQLPPKVVPMAERTRRVRPLLPREDLEAGVREAQDFGADRRRENRGA